MLICTIDVRMVCRGAYCATQSMVTNFFKHVSLAVFRVPLAMFSTVQFLIAYGNNKLTVRSHSENILITFSSFPANCPAFHHLRYWSMLICISLII